MLDKLRETGWGVDFPDESSKLERAQGRVRISAYAQLHGCSVSDMFRDFGLQGWCKCDICESGGLGNNPPDAWYKAGEPDECAVPEGECASTGEGCGSPVSSEGGDSGGGEDAESVCAESPVGVDASETGGIGAGDGGERTVYFARTKCDLEAGYPRHAVAAPIAMRAGALLQPALVYKYGLRPQMVAGVRGPFQSPTSVFTARVARDGESSGGAGEGGSDGGSVKRTISGAGGDDAAVSRPPRKLIAQEGGVKVKRTSNDRLYITEYEKRVSTGMNRLDADLIAHVYVAWRTCGCDVCSRMYVCPWSLNDLLPSNARVGCSDEFIMQQYILPSDCECVVELQRFEKMRTK
jgi:hypothetical protein